MDPVTVGRYGTDWPEGHPALDHNGWVKTKDWVLFEMADGSLTIYAGTDPETGDVTNAIEVFIRPAQREVQIGSGDGAHTIPFRP